MRQRWEGGDELVDALDMPTGGLMFNMLINKKFPVAIPELPLLVGYCLFHHFLILVSIRKRGFQEMLDQARRVQPGGGDIWNRYILEQADLA